MLDYVCFEVLSLIRYLKPNGYLQGGLKLLDT